MKKKSYNPFKMWGSYAGIVLGITTFIFFMALVFAHGMSGGDRGLPFPYIIGGIISLPMTIVIYLSTFGWELPEILRIPLLIFLFVVNIVYWFFITYVIHALIRKVKN